MFRKETKQTVNATDTHVLIEMGKAIKASDINILTVMKQADVVLLQTVNNNLDDSYAPKKTAQEVNEIRAHLHATP